MGDADLANLEDLRDVEVLDLSGTEVTDAGLEYLKGLVQLQMLLLAQTRVTDAGVRRLREFLPQTAILH
jgi:hypothetical protein